MTTNPDSIPHVAQLEENYYNRIRLFPAPGTDLYLHLSDLRLGLDRLSPLNDAKVIDYGCGGSPYQSLFTGCLYHRADIKGTPGIDFEFGGDSRITATSGGYDCVLSTQVLEHVRDVEIYLSECRRLLAPGGRLILSTHGVFHDHGCPYDFRRWTADGLKLELQKAGFEITRIFKLTTGPRALALLNQHYHRDMIPKERSLIAWTWRMSWLLYQKTRRRLNAFLDREYSSHRVVDADEKGHDFYIALLVEARPV